MSITVIGVGQERRSDAAIGLHIARSLADRALPADIEIIEVPSVGIELIPAMEGTDRALIITALDTDASPGAVSVITPEDLSDGAVIPNESPGHVNLGDVFELAEMVDLVPEIYIIAVQPKLLAPGYALSPELEAALPLAAAEAQRILDLWLHTSANGK